MSRTDQTTQRMRREPHPGALRHCAERAPCGGVTRPHRPLGGPCRPQGQCVGGIRVSRTGGLVSLLVAARCMVDLALEP